MGCNPVSIAKADVWENDEWVMLHMVQYNFHGRISTIIFFDDGATCSIIKHNLAKALGRKGRKVTQFVETAGRDFAAGYYDVLCQYQGQPEGEA